MSAEYDIFIRCQSISLMYNNTLAYGYDALNNNWFLNVINSHIKLKFAEFDVNLTLSTTNSLI